MLIFPDIKNITIGGEMEWEARMEKQQGLTIQYRELDIQYPMINYNGKDYF